MDILPDEIKRIVIMAAVISGALPFDINQCVVLVTQAFARGYLSRDEARSIAELAPALVHAIEPNGPRIFLCRADDGDLTAAAIVNSVKAAKDEIETAFAALPHRMARRAMEAWER